MSVSKSNNNKLPSNLPQLQNLIKRDPASYLEEFDRQYAIYSATKDIFEQDPTQHNASFHELIMFFSQIAHCYSSRLTNFPEDLVQLLESHGPNLHPDARLGFVKALVLLRNKNLLSPTALLQLFFKLLRSPDKNLRTFLKEHIVNDIKNINMKGKNMKLNNKLQNFMFDMLKDNHAVAIKTSLDVMIDLYKKRVWNDSKTVNIIASACFNKIIKVAVAAVKFFIGNEEEEEKKDSSDSDSDEEDLPSLQRVRLQARFNKGKKSKYEKKEEKIKHALVKKQNKKNTKSSFDFSAIHLIHDPQSMAEKLYKRLEKMNERFEVKLMVMNLISRLVGIHQLYLPNFYPYLQRYLFVHQREVTKIMAYAAQAAHPLASPDDLEPVIKTLANNFVTERYSGEVMAMGINAIRELCARNPYSISEDLVQDLAAYKSHKDKAVSMAARSLIGLFREKNPELLAKKDKGAPTELAKENKIKQFGQSDAQDFIPGAEVLTFKTIEENEKRRRADSSSDEEWVDVSDSEQDSEDEEKKEVKCNKHEKISDQTEKIYTKKEALKEVMKLTPEERAARATEVLTSRVLTDEDFAKIDAMQAAKQVERYSASRKKRKQQEVEQNKGEIVRLSSIEMVHKKRRHDKESRLETIMEGREGRQKFGSRKGRMNPHASTTNREKIKAKSFMMMKHKIRSSKQRLNFREKQIQLRDALLKHKLK